MVLWLNKINTDMANGIAGKIAFIEIGRIYPNMYNENCCLATDFIRFDVVMLATAPRPGVLRRSILPTTVHHTTHDVLTTQSSTPS